MSDKKTGLGKAALFQTPNKQKANELQQAAGDDEPKREKFTTSMRLYKDTTLLLETCKLYAQKERGYKVPVSDIVEEAIKEWAAKRNIEV